MIPGGTRTMVAYRRCASCRTNVALLDHVEGSEDCRLAGEERAASMAEAAPVD